MKDNKSVKRLKDIAEYCGVSPSTVSRVVNKSGYVSPIKTNMIEDAVRRFGYIPSAAARLVRTGEAYKSIPSQTIRMIIGREDSSNYFYSEFNSYLVEEAAGMGYQIILSYPSEYSNDILCDGIITNIIDKKININNLPVVTADVLSADPLVPGVIPDYETGIYKAVKISMDKGYKNPILVSGLPEDVTCFNTMLYKGFSRALIEENLEPEKHLYRKNIKSIESGYNAGKTLLDKKNCPDLIFCNDEAAIGLYRAAFEKGKSIPNELGIIGCDGLLITEYMVPKLATIKIDFQNFAREVLKRIIPAILGHPGPYPQKLLLEMKFIVNESINKED